MIPNLFMFKRGLSACLMKNLFQNVTEICLQTYENMGIAEIYILKSWRHVQIYKYMKFSGLALKCNLLNLTMESIIYH